MNKISSKIIQKTDVNALKSHLDITALQKSIRKSLAENLNELEKYTTQEMPQNIISQENAIKGLEQLSNYAKGMIK